MPLLKPEQLDSHFDPYEDTYKILGVRIPLVTIPKEVYKDLGIDENVDEHEFLRELCRIGYKEKGINNYPNKKVYVDRINQELETLKKLGFSRYILMVWDLVRWCDNQKIPRGWGRGSVSGSIISWLTGLTALDPIKYGLIFERFLNEARAKVQIIDGELYADGGSVPDIDSDFSFMHREEIIKEYFESQYPNKTCHISTLNTLSTKLVLKEVCKKAGFYSETDANKISSLVESMFGNNQTIDETVENNVVFQSWAKQEPELLRIAKQLSDLPRNFGVHAAGVIVSYDPIYDTIPYEFRSDEEATRKTVCSYTKDDAAEQVIKVDVLGLKVLDVIYKTAIESNFDLDSFNHEESCIYDYLQDFNYTYGIFQLDGDTASKVTRKVKPKDITQISAVSAIARPGALQFLKAYTKYLDDGEFAQFYEPIDEILKETGGVIIYQEQIMKIATDVYNFTSYDADILRKVIGKKKKDEIAEWESKIKEAGEKVGVPENATEIFWKSCNASADYLFNRCLLPDTFVETPNGTKLMGEIRKGDEVKAYNTKENNSHFVKVVNIYENYVPVYIVKTESGKSIGSSMNHKFLTPERGMQELSVVLDEDLSVITEQGYEKIISQKYLGIRRTLDFEVNHPDHNFYAEGMVVSNSHALLYSYITALCIYLKVKYPAAFFKNCLILAKTYSDSEAKMLQIYNELSSFGVNILPPDLLKSEEDFSVEGNTIRYGLKSIRSVQEKTLAKIKEFTHEYSSKFAMFEAASKSKIGVNVLVNLIRAGCLRSYGDHRGRLVLEAQVWNLLTESQKGKVNKYGEKYNFDLLTLLKDIKEGKLLDDGKEIISTVKRRNKNGESSPWDTFYKKYSPLKLEYIQYNKHRDFYDYYYEQDVMGFSFDKDITDILKTKSETYKYIKTIHEIRQEPVDTTVTFAGIIQEVKIGKTKKGNKMLSLDISDNSGRIHCKIFNYTSFDKQTKIREEKENVDDIQREYGRFPTKRDIIVARGTAKEGTVFIEKMKILNEDYKK